MGDDRLSMRTIPIREGFSLSVIDGGKCISSTYFDFIKRAIEEKGRNFKVNLNLRREIEGLTPILRKTVEFYSLEACFLGEEESFPLGKPFARVEISASDSPETSWQNGVLSDYITDITYPLKTIENWVPGLDPKKIGISHYPSRKSEKVIDDQFRIRLLDLINAFSNANLGENILDLGSKYAYNSENGLFIEKGSKNPLDLKIDGDMHHIDFYEPSRIITQK